MDKDNLKIKFREGDYIVDEDDKLYREYSDGIVETSFEEEEKKIERSGRVIEYLELWTETYTGHNWSIDEYPKDADAYILCELYRRKSQQLIIELYNEADDNEFLKKMLHFFCCENIAGLQIEIANPYVENKTLKEYSLKVFEQIDSFVLNLPAFVSQSKQPVHNNSDKLSHKQQILLLERLGIFDLSFFEKLNEKQKGKLFGALLNRDEKNTEDFIRYRNHGKKDVSSKVFIKTPGNSEKINQLLNDLGLDNKI